MKNNILLCISLSILHSMKNVYTKFVEKIDTHFKFNIPPSPTNAGYVCMKKDVEHCRPQMTI
jgi:hypothetical protein